VVCGWIDDDTILTKITPHTTPFALLRTTSVYLMMTPAHNAASPVMRLNRGIPLCFFAFGSQFGFGTGAKCGSGSSIGKHEARSHLGLAPQKDIWIVATRAAHG
jgi:hypothetical protein